jgi:Fur family peroxide stress response transcriptional regulator
MNIGEVIGHLKDSGNRVTVQRQLILEYLFHKLSHPTVEEIYSAISAVYPSYVSMPTIYNNMRVFKEFGLVKDIYVKQIGVTRYDTNTGPHHHLVCLDCGKITDCDAEVSLSLHFDQGQPFRAQSFYLEVYGVCPECDAVQGKTMKESVTLESKESLTAGYTVFS